MSVVGQVCWLRDREDMSGGLIGIKIKIDMESEETKETYVTSEVRTYTH
jgi:hypothetical protein